MKVVIVHASKHGGTRGIAERIGETLREQGCQVDIRPVEDDPDPRGYQAVVLGSAVYYGRWMKDASAYAERWATSLTSRPLWLFSSGPTGIEMREEHLHPNGVDELATTLGARSHEVFFGRLDMGQLSFRERLIVKGVKAPTGDFRNWNDVDVWAKGIAGDLG